MIAFGHNSVGTLIGLAAFSYLPEGIPLPARLGIALLCGILSHYLTDAIPHGHYEFDPRHLTKKMVGIFALDYFGSVGLLLGLALWQFGFTQAFFMTFAGMAGAQLPDIWETFVTAGFIPRSRLVMMHRNFHTTTLHRKTPKHLMLSDGETRMWSISDIWQVSCLLAAVSAILFI